jgi:hypothetical protein
MNERRGTDILNHGIVLPLSGQAKGDEKVNK